jgi:Acyclic terpene utilisation family protein AtuA
VHNSAIIGRMAASPLRIANCSGFFGDRVAAAREMVEGGPIDVLTGDWLAELTMFILSRTRTRRADGGFARTFITQMEQVLGTCLERGIKIVANAGGLDPAGCAAAVEQVAARLGVNARVAWITGDDVVGRLGELQAGGHALAHLDTGEPFGDVAEWVVTANAYLGCWGIVNALERGADVVITGRVTDAAVVIGPAAWHHGWARTDWDRLAGAVVAGHVIECGAQATGGNYSFFTEIADLRHPGFPWAEIAADGSFVVGKHEGTGGAVNVGTVTSQLLYEIGGPRYGNPDVVTRFDTISLEQVADDRVRVSGVRGEPAPAEVKLAINYVGGYRNSMSFALTGLDIEAKAALVESQLWASFPDGAAHFESTDVRLIRSDREDPPTNELATAWLRVTVKDRDEAKVGRAFADAAVALGLASIPGFYGGSPPGGASVYGVYWPTLVPATFVHHEVVLDGTTEIVENTTVAGGERFTLPDPTPLAAALPEGPTARRALGTIVGARSGDKGGAANVGLFTRAATSFEWLDAFLTEERFRALLPAETEGLRVERHRFPNLWSLNFVVHGLLGRGVAESSRQDAQAKVVDIPIALPGESTANRSSS